MTAATLGPSGPNLFSMFSARSNGLSRTNREAFLLSFLGQCLLLAVVVYLTKNVVPRTPTIAGHPIDLSQLPLIFSGHNGGGGGNHDAIPASRGNLPKASLEQIVPPTVVLPKEMPRLVAEPTVMIAPEIKYPLGGVVGDPLSKFSIPSDGPGGPGGHGSGCCGGIGPSTGPGAGVGPEGIYPAGKQGVTLPQVIYKPDPSFSDEARKSKTQGIVVLLVVVGKDGHTYNIRVGQSLGMGLEEKAMETVQQWRFRPATLNGVPVATRIAVEVDFRLY